MLSQLETPVAALKPSPYTRLGVGVRWIDVARTRVSAQQLRGKVAFERVDSSRVLTRLKIKQMKVVIYVWKAFLAQP